MITLLLTALIVLAIVGLILWGIRQIPGIPPIATYHCGKSVIAPRAGNLAKLSISLHADRAR